MTKKEKSIIESVLKFIPEGAEKAELLALLSGAPAKAKTKTIEGLALLYALRTSRSSLPILTKLHAKNGLGTVSNMDRIISAPVTLPDGIYTLLSGKEAVLDTSFELEDFPIYTASEPDFSFELSRSDLEALNALVPFASTEEDRYILNGVCLDFPAGSAVATDGRRLSVEKMNLPIVPKTIKELSPGKMEKEPSFPRWADSNGRAVLHSSLIQAAGKAFADLEEGETVQLSFHRHTLYSIDCWAVSLTAKDRTVSHKVIDGTFPNYPQVIPAGTEAECCTIRDLSGIAEAVRSLKPRMKGDSAPIARLELNRSGAHKVIYHSPESNDLNAEIPVKALTDWKVEDAFENGERKPVDSLSIGLNPDFILDCIARNPDSLLIRDGLDPVIFKRGGEFQSVQMPIRIS